MIFSELKIMVHEYANHLVSSGTTISLSLLSYTLFLASLSFSSLGGASSILSQMPLSLTKRSDNNK